MFAVKEVALCCGDEELRCRVSMEREVDVNKTHLTTIRVGP